MRKYFSLLPYFSILAVLFSHATIAASPIQADVSASYTYDDNITRADLDRDIEKDNILSLDATARYKIPFKGNSYFSVKGTAEFNQYQTFNKLSNNRLGIHGSYHIRPFGGYTASRFFIQATYEQRMYDSDQRNGSATLLQLGLSKRLTDRVTLYAGFIKEDVDADDPVGVFDADNQRLYLEVDIKTKTSNTPYLAVNYFDGDIVSTTAPNSDIINAARPFIVRDDAFLDLTPSRFAYKLKAKTTAFKLGNTYAIRSNQAVDASLFYYNAESSYGISYSGLIASLSYLYRF